MVQENTLEDFRKRRDLWIACLASPDPHCIRHQICDMVWNSAVFRVVNEARRLASPVPQGGVELNGLVHEFLDHCFFENQGLAVRRLTDTYPITSCSQERDVYSLTSLLDDMKCHAHLITRGNIFAVEGIKDDSSCGYAEKRHEQIDYFSGVPSSKRSPHDSVRPEVFSHLMGKVETACNSIRPVVNKFIAHAATPGSRQTVCAISPDDLWRAQRVICEVANFADTYFLTGSSHLCLLATPQYDQFRYIDRPLVDRKDVGKLREVWDAYAEETIEWNSWGIKELMEELDAPWLTSKGTR